MTITRGILSLVDYGNGWHGDFGELLIKKHPQYPRQPTFYLFKEFPLSIELTEHITSPEMFSIEQAMLETLAYSDIFDYPLRVEEIHRYLSLPVSLSELNVILSVQDQIIKMVDGYYVIAGREYLVALRRHREIASRQILERAIRYGRLLGSLPFIRMVGLTGSLALQNCDSDADIDYLLVASHGRVWLARALALLLGRITSIFSDTLCPNLIISEHVLEWQQRDLYTARELCQMIPISGSDVYIRFRQANTWTNSYLPNASNAPGICPGEMSRPTRLRSIWEWPFRGAFGDRLEEWEMGRKIKRFMKQEGLGPETKFNRDICQGNFNQHGLETKLAYQNRLSSLRMRVEDL